MKKSQNLDVKDDQKWRNPQTIVLLTAYRSDLDAHSVAVPIYQTAAYNFTSSEHAERVFCLQEDGNTYTRVMNPTCDVLERRVNALEGGAAGLSFASGQAATICAILNLCRAGDNVVTSTRLYGGTWNIMANLLKDMGVEARFVDADDVESFRRETDNKTRCYFGETLPNPQLRMFPIREVADIGDELGIPLIVDNTLAPLICRPFDHGASIVIHSTTKYINGHGNSIGGMLVDSGKFDWRAYPERFPMFTQPDPGHGGVIWTEVLDPLTSALGQSAYMLRARMIYLRDIGACMSPFNAFLTLQGLETLPLRMKAHCINADATAKMLAAHPKVAFVTHPSMTKGEERRRVDKYLRGGHGALLTFELKGGEEAGRKFMAALQLIYNVPNIGDSRSLASHPASTTHVQLPPEDRLAAGVTPGGVRLSVGIEHIEDIFEDLNRALERV